MTRHRIRGWGAAGALWLALGAAPAVAAPPVASVAGLVQRAENELAAHPGRAVADYERARLLAPRASEVRAGLGRARAAAGLPPASPGAVGRLIERLSPDEWSWLALAGLALAAAGVTAAAWRRRRRWSWPAAALGVAVAVASGAVAWRTAPRPNDAIVVGGQTVARIAPFAAAEEAFLAPDGARVTIQGTHQGFARIESDRGAGWVPSSAVERIIPPS